MTRQSKRAEWDVKEILEYDNTEQIYLLTEQEATAMLTVVANQMKWATRWAQYEQNQDFIQNFTSTLGNKLMLPTDFCTRVIQCVVDALEQGDNTLTITLNQYFQQQGIVSSETALETVLGGATGDYLDQNLLESLPCGNDEFFGYATAITDYLHQMSLDLLEQVSGQTTTAELLIQLWGAIPFLGEIGDGVGIMIDWIGDEFVEKYESAWTLAVRDKIRCDLFCIMQENCEISPADLWEYFVIESGQQWANGDTLLDIVVKMFEFATGGGVVFGMHAILTSAWAVGAVTLGQYGVKPLKTVLITADPDPDWIICPVCPPPTVSFQPDTNFIPCWAPNESGSFVGIVFDYGDGWKRYRFYPDQVGIISGVYVKDTQGRLFDIRNVASQPIALQNEAYLDEFDTCAGILFTSAPLSRLKQYGVSIFNQAFTYVDMDIRLSP